MYRDNIELQVHQKINYVLNNAAVGDTITSLPAIIYAKAVHPNMEMIIWTPNYLMDLISLLLYPYGDFFFRDLAHFPLKADERDRDEDGPVVVNGVLRNQVTRNRISLVDYAFGPLLDMWPENNLQRNYPTGAPLGKRTISGPYVVVPVNATSDNKVFHPKVLEPVLVGLLDRGHLPVIVGKSHTQLKAIGADNSLIDLHMRSNYDSLPQSLRDECRDMRDQTSLVGLRNLCGYAAATVGMDGGTIHVAGTTMAPIVYIQTSVDPRHRVITREGVQDWHVEHVVPHELECAGCQSNWVLMFRHDFMTCAYGDNLCVEKIRPEDVLGAFDKLVSEGV